MAGEKTGFIPEYDLFFPVKNLPKLFGIFETRSRRQFLEKIALREQAGGEGVSIDELASIIQIGLSWKRPGITIEDVWDLIQQYNDLGNGYEDLENLIADALADSGITDKALHVKRKHISKELREVELKIMQESLDRRKAQLTQTGEEELQEIIDKKNEKLKALGVGNDMGEGQSQT